MRILPVIICTCYVTSNNIWWWFNGGRIWVVDVSLKKRSIVVAIEMIAQSQAHICCFGGCYGQRACGMSMTNN